MPFSDRIKLKVKRKSAFRCCRCQNIGVEIHHIISEAHGGSNDIQNAAPLCAKCHADFGDNALKRKEITEMRDWWFEKAELLFASNRELAPLEEKIDTLVIATQQKSEMIDDLKAALKEYVNIKIDKITPVNSSFSSSSIVNASVTPESAVDDLSTLWKVASKVMGNAGSKDILYEMRSKENIKKLENIISHLQNFLDYNIRGWL